MSDSHTAAPDLHAEVRRLRLRAKELEEQRDAVRHELRESERRFRETLDNARLVAVWLDLDGRVTFCNDALLRLTGYSREEVVGCDWFDRFVPAGDRAAMKERFGHNARRAELVNHFENEILTRAGERRLIAWNNTPLRGPDGEQVGTSGLGEDVTDQRRAEAALRASEARFRAFMDHNPAPAWITDTDGRLVYMSASGLRTLRLPSGDPVGRTVFDLFTESHAREFVANIRAAAAYGTVIEADEPVVRADGSAGWFLTHKFPLPPDAGPNLVGGVAVDITDRRRAEAALRASEQRYRQLFEAAPLPMWIYDAQSLSFLAVNSAAVRQYGWSTDEFLGMTTKDIRPPEDVPALLAALPALAPAPTYQGVWRHRTKDGRVLEVEVSSHALRFDGRQARCVVAHDVTEQRRLESQLRQAQKLEAVGRLAGGVAHDFNNLLTAILGFADVLLDGLPEGDGRREAAQEVRKAGERAADLTRQLLAFGRRQILLTRTLDLSSVVADMENLLRRVIGKDVKLDTIPAERPLPVVADPGELERVILNLAVNARDAMRQGGKLTIATSAATLTPDDLHDHPDLRPGEYTVLTVTDTGTGMDAATKARLFEPFFTTKKIGEGTGLGLATAYGVIKQTGGDITVKSALGEGTTFTIHLPRASRPSDVIKPTAAAPAVAGSETVLVVEDEDSIRVLVRLILTRQGYRVLEAADGAAALSLVEGHRGPIHLLVSDVVMPGMSGPDLAARLTDKRPAMLVLFLSGHAEDEVLRRGGSGAAALLHKPFMPAALAAKVREVLDRKVVTERRTTVRGPVTP